MEFSDTHLKIEHPQRKGYGKSSMTVKVVDEKYTDAENLDVIDQAIHQLEHMRSQIQPARWVLGERWPITPHHSDTSRRVIFIKEFRGVTGCSLKVGVAVIDHFLMASVDPVPVAIKWANANQDKFSRLNSAGAKSSLDDIRRLLMEGQS